MTQGNFRAVRHCVCRQMHHQSQQLLLPLLWYGHNGTYLSCSAASGQGKGRARGLRGGCCQALQSRRQHLGCRCKQTLQLLLLLPPVFTPCITHLYVYVVTPVAGLVAHSGYSICMCSHVVFVLQPYCLLQGDVACSHLPMDFACCLVS